MLWNAIFIAFKEIRRNILRSLLTMLGIVIGVAVVMTMVTVGDGATLQVSQQIQSLGSNLVMVAPSGRMGPVKVGFVQQLFAWQISRRFDVR